MFLCVAACSRRCVSAGFALFIVVGIRLASGNSAHLGDPGIGKRLKYGADGRMRLELLKLGGFALAPNFSDRGLSRFFRKHDDPAPRRSTA